MKFLMVCLGNICRSPIAHGLLKHKAEQLGLNWEIDSAGTSGYHQGELPDRQAIECMKKHGIDITYQRSRPFSKRDFAAFDVIYCMDRNNYWDVRSLAENETEEQKVMMILNEVNAGSDSNVPDPYYGGKEDFEMVYAMLDKATDAIVTRYNPTH